MKLTLLIGVDCFSCSKREPIWRTACLASRILFVYVMLVLLEAEVFLISAQFLFFIVLLGDIARKRPKKGTKFPSSKAAHLPDSLA